MSRTLTIALILGALPSAAFAQLSDEERARVHFQTGTSYYDQGRYEEAAQQFRESYTLSRRSHILLNVSRCLELAGDFEPAADALEEYLQAEPAAPDRRTIEQRVEQLRARAAAAAPPETGEPSEPGGGPDLTVPAILLGAGGALLLGAVATGVATLSIQSSLEEDCPGRVDCDPSRRGDADTGQALAITTDVLIGVGGATAAVGVVLLAIALADGGDDPSAAAACTGDGCFLAVRGRL